ncbi:MAG TPA: hypothetical protein VMG36_01975 [Thermoplasmata archaeon]|nr:hypothetical protein [Thermoplasmata archaeon]
MRRSYPITIAWVALIAGLLALEIAELTHFFTLPVASVVADPAAIVTALVFTTLLAVVGAIFVGLYISHRILAPTGFTPFEQEMLQMRQDVEEIRSTLQELRGGRPSTPVPPPVGGPRTRGRP